MLREDKYFRDLTEGELWQRYCGFLDLSIDEFMGIQEELLMDEIERVSDSLLGQKIMGGRKPTNVEEFRSIVPLTTYGDYEPYLGEKREDAIAKKPLFWCHSSGKGGYFKWIPHSSQAVEKGVRSYLAGFILSATSRKGAVNIGPGFRFLCIVAPRPYMSGYLLQNIRESISVRVIPSIEEDAPFHERIRKGFQAALKDGVDIIGALTSILAKIGEEFDQQARAMKFSVSLLHPKIVYRMTAAWLRSKRERRSILPKDIWRTKGIYSGGVDTAIYSDTVTRYWGSPPHEMYGGAEGLIYAIQAWNRKGMTFLPDLVFLEFIPYEEVLKQQNDQDYQPSTVLLNEVEQGKWYEVVVTQFYGMPLLRYRLNDIIRVIALSDEEAGIKLPQIVFQRRGGEVIGLAGLVDLDERTIWQAIVNTGVRFTEWSACNEYDENKSYLRLYLELKEKGDPDKIADMINREFKAIDVDYRDLDSYLEHQPVRVTLLSPGTFQRYIDERLSQGADLAHLKPSHVNPPEAAIQRLLEFNKMREERP